MKEIHSAFDVSRRFNPYIIAEAGVNHEGDLDLAKRLVDEAKLGGADAIKFQTYKAEKIASINSPAYWDLKKERTESQFELFKKYDGFGECEYQELAKYCAKADIEFMSTPFDLESANFLNPLVNVFKISSSDITNKPFLEHIGSLNKPIILSTGASFVHEIQEALGWLEPYNVPVALLHCVLDYPTADENANLAMITDLQDKFPSHVVGYSDHTLPGEMKILETAAVLGARIIEKHFTHDKNLPGNDHYHAMDYNDLLTFQHRLKVLQAILGNVKKEPLENERSARLNARRSLVLARPLNSGDRLSIEDLTWKRPGTGISPKYVESVLSMKVTRDIKIDEILNWRDIDT
ncbi:N-acetylneuraminate synthase family protein [Pseudobacteriovorax antillogorgiicola]|uniref:N-acetylneuraminate synthase n=1 Tax=Pseudobacteriovorax antillogorgiicola TaxID=1513793 RepID=A0A1Y6CTG6_9BACT|nr:N-acetylneuraminate synthase family protein [Pseudobacteriovorax antillogorgiicola]TCS45181.1 N-acetylneuraminate synthase [Pseudobacteriovorax antillogorgiicola]SMF75708.1 N-acetylneuraminate synthase [Pseudobacteriovorax antillogorgiicola]